MLDGAIVKDEVRDEVEALINQFSHLSLEDIEIREECALSEQVSHHLAYHAHFDSEEILLYEKAQTQHRYTVYWLDVEDEALKVKILLPHKANLQHFIYVLFQGTADLATIHADTQSLPGEKTFHQCKNLLMKKLNDAIFVYNQQNKSKSIPITVVFAGHSLGGSYAEQMLTELIRIQAFHLLEDRTEWLKANQKLADYLLQEYALNSGEIDRGHTALLNQIKHIKLMTKASAGISYVVAQMSNTMADLLIGHGLTIDAHMTVTDDDLIHRTGQANILLDSQANITLVIFNLSTHSIQQTFLKGILNFAATLSVAMFLNFAILPGGMLTLVASFVFMLRYLAERIYQAHTKFYFKDSELLDKVLSEIISNRTQSGRLKIKNYLEDKSYLINNSFAKNSKAIANKFIGFLFKNKNVNNITSLNENISKLKAM